MHSFNALDLLHVGAGTPTPGMVVFTSRLLLVRSYGIVSDRIVGAKPCVISGSIRAGLICEQTWEAFSRGNGVSIYRYPDTSSDLEVLRRARWLVGSRYNPLTWRGEHAFAHELKPTSVGILLLAFLLALHAFKAL